MGHVALPSGAYAGKVADGVVDQYRQLTKWIKRREKWCAGVKPVPSAAVIHPISNLRLTGMIRGDWQDDVSGGVCGAHKMLVESHWPVDIIGEETLGELGRFELIVVPEIPYVSDELAAELTDYVNNGGTLLATGPSSLMDERGRRRDDFALAELLGIHYVTKTEFSARYLEVAEGFAEGIPAMPILVKAGGHCPGFGRFIDISVEPGTEVLAEFVDPPFEANLQRHVYHQHGHPAARSGAAGVVTSKRGQGRVVFSATPIFEDYWCHNSPWLRRLLDNVLEAVLPDRLLRTDLPGWASVTVMSKEGMTIVHVVNWHEGPRGGTGLSYVEETAPLRGALVSLRDDHIERVYKVGDHRRPVHYEQNGNRVEVKLSRVDTHDMIVFEHKPNAK
jgi:hypothetical protein